jgi:cobalt-zinc-cadmium efflux system outer membrane protein
VQAAIDRGGRLGVARANAAVASASLLAARAFPNPSLSLSYSKDQPPYHGLIELPLDLWWLRRLRVQSAQLGLQAAQIEYQLARATIGLDADTIYTNAIAARERLALAQRNAHDADSLLHMVERRRDAGDASDLDVELARVNAGQEANVAAADSLTWIGALLDLQAVLGLASDHVEVSATDSLTMPSEAPAPGAMTLGETAASLTLESAIQSARLQHRSLWVSPALTGGFDWGDATQNHGGPLPTFGIGIGLPLLDRNRGAIAQAEAERTRASAELTLAHIEARTEVAHGTHEWQSATARVRRDQAVAASADRVAAMSLTAYREGAAALPNVLEAQRTARDVMGQYIDDLAAAWIAAAELRVLALTPSTTSQP